MARTQTITWRNEDTASQALIDPLLDDIGIKGSKIREAIKAYCLRLIFEEQWTMGDLNMAVVSFYEGYNASLSK